MILDSNGVVDKTIQFCSTLIRHSKFDEAQPLLEQALKVDPDNKLAKEMLSYLLAHKDDEGVVEFYENALKVNPDCHMTRNNLALKLSGQGDYEGAVLQLQEAIQLDPENPVYWNNLGLQAKKLNVADDAIYCFEQSLAYDRDPYVLVNLGSAHADKLDLDKAIECFQEALTIKPGLSGAHINMAYCYHLQGKHDLGWQNYEYRLGHFAQSIAYMNKMGADKKWDGRESLDGKRVMVFCEQGYGDTIMMCRYFKSLKSRGCHVICQCPEALASLLQYVEGIDEINTKENFVAGRYSPYDLHVPTMSLPLLLGEFEPSGSPYIQVDDLRFGTIESEKVKVGVCWQGSALHPNDATRSVMPKFFEDLQQVSGYEWHSLQLEPCSDRFIDHSSCIKTFRDTAEIIRNMDLIISVDTSVVHLAGALGKTTWCILSHRPDFRWGLGETTKWYDSVRLFRQHSIGNWKSVHEAVKTALEMNIA